MCGGIIEFVCWVAFVAIASSFLLGLAKKWHLLEWLQIHAPNDFFNEMFSCKFCMSWWTGVIISLTLCIVAGEWWLVFIPLCSTTITRELW